MADEPETTEEQEGLEAVAKGAVDSGVASSKIQEILAKLLTESTYLKPTRKAPKQHGIFHTNVETVDTARINETFRRIREARGVFGPEPPTPAAAPQVPATATSVFPKPPLPTHYDFDRWLASERRAAQPKLTPEIPPELKETLAQTSTPAPETGLRPTVPTRAPEIGPAESARAEPSTRERVDSGKSNASKVFDGLADAAKKCIDALIKLDQELVRKYDSP